MNTIENNVKSLLEINHALIQKEKELLIIKECLLNLLAKKDLKKINL